MTAEIKPRIDLEGRTRLEKVIPLATPYLIFLDPSDICNARCRWCPTGSGEADKYKKAQLMDPHLYKKIINDLCDMPSPIKTLRLYSDGEPLLHPALPQMIHYAKQKGRFGQIDTTTNGILLTPGLGARLIDAGLDKIFISVPQDYDDKYVEKIRTFYNNTKTNLDGSYCKVYVKIIGDYMTQLEKEMFFNDFEQISDRVFIENLAPCWPDFDVGRVGSRGIYDQEIGKGVEVCPYIFYSLKINSDGTVSLCFLDWKHQVILGDLKKESFKDIWNGPALLGFRTVNLCGQRKSFYPMCRSCGQMIYGAPDDIDAYAPKLLKKLWRDK